MHCPLDDQKPLEEQVVIEKFKQCLLVQITSALLITNYDKVLLQIKTAFFYYKLSFYKLRHVFQITTKLEIRFLKNLAKLTGSAVRTNSKMPKGKIIRGALAREARAAELHG